MKLAPLIPALAALLNVRFSAASRGVLQTSTHPPPPYDSGLFSAPPPPGAMLIVWHSTIPQTTHLGASSMIRCSRCVTCQKVASALTASMVKQRIRLSFARKQVLMVSVINWLVVRFGETVTVSRVTSHIVRLPFCGVHRKPGLYAEIVLSSNTSTVTRTCPSCRVPEHSADRRSGVYRKLRVCEPRRLRQPCRLHGSRCLPLPVPVHHLPMPCGTKPLSLPPQVSECTSRAALIMAGVAAIVMSAHRDVGGLSVRACGLSSCRVVGMRLRAETCCCVSCFVCSRRLPPHADADTVLMLPLVVKCFVLVQCSSA